MQCREERSERIQVKGTSSEREIEEQRKSRNMQTVRKRGKNAVEGRTAHEVGKTLWGKLRQREDKTHVKHPQATYCVQLPLFTSPEFAFSLNIRVLLLALGQLRYPTDADTPGCSWSTLLGPVFLTTAIPYQGSTLEFLANSCLMAFKTNFQTGL